MSTPGTPIKSPSPVRQPVLLGLFTGTAVGAGFLLAGVPNVELMTLIIALCGGVLGARPALAAGALAAVVYSLGSPFGLPVPLMLAAQACGMGCAGVLGAFGGNRVLRSHYKGRSIQAMVWAVAIGLGSTFIFDLLTNLAIIGAFDMNASVVMAGAVPFVLLHMGSNAVIFGVLMPLLLPRLAGLNRSALVGRSGTALALALLVVGTAVEGQAEEPAVADTTAAAVIEPTPAVLAKPDTVLTGPEKAFGWQRPLWTPFARTNLEWLDWNSSRAPIIDGGLGAPVVILGEAGTSWNPLFERDGIPVGTGHMLTDDPWLTPTEGLVVDDLTHSRDGWGGTGGLVALRTEDPNPGKAVSAYRGVKGKHETYFRSVHLLTPKAAWRAAFEFEESVDIEGYNYTDQDDANFVADSGIPFPGHSRMRQSRTRLFRELDPDNRLIVEFTNGRLTKDGLPAYGAEHLELWDSGLAATMQTGLGSWQLDTKIFWRDRDVIWGDRQDLAVIGIDSRKLETGREGLSLDLYRGVQGDRPTTGITLQATNWYVDDSLTADAWLDDFSGTGRGDGQTARGMMRTGWGSGAAVMEVGLGADWHSYVGAAPEAFLSLRAGGEKPWWALNAAYGGRAPRSDELLTPLQRDVAGRNLSLLPNADLEREETTRLGLILQTSLLGFDFAVDGSVTRLRDGITWRASPQKLNVGQWYNDLEMTSNRVTGSVAKQGRFLGWARVMVEGTWQQSDETQGQAAFLPPEQYLRSHLMWENHFFEEDGILQLALISTVQAEMNDPWDVTRSAVLPSRTMHDLLVVFRLVGAHLGLGIRNVTGERVVLTSGALSTGQEMNMRLHWAWVY